MVNFKRLPFKNYYSFGIFVLRFPSESILENLVSKGHPVVLEHPVYIHIILYIFILNFSAEVYSIFTDHIFNKKKSDTYWIYFL